MGIGRIRAYGDAVYAGYVKIYSCKIYDNGTLVRDFIPCLNPDGEAGMYDFVNETFRGASGTGDFIYG
jgi:hypothetical protein